MFNIKKIFILFAVSLCFLGGVNSYAFSEELANSTAGKYPNYSCMYLGEDKCEGFNRKMFNFNSKLNKFIIKPVHIVWASIMPQYGMDRIKGVYTNIEYPKRLVSTLLQRDLKASGRETLRFLTNSTIGLGGMFDPAKRFFKLEPADENMEQALCKCKCNSGPFLVLPGFPATSPRALAGKALDTALNPTCYIASPVLALVKLGFTLNQTTDLEPLAELIESTYADPYDITRKMYGLDRYIKANNLDRKSVIAKNMNIPKEENIETVNNDTNAETQVMAKTPETSETLNDGDLIAYNDLFKDGVSKTSGSFVLKNEKPKADITLNDYQPQTPVIDAMRTALFDLPEVEKSIWSDFSIWNRCFRNKIKTSKVNIDPLKADYKFKYIMQKDKNSPVAIIYPSIGEGITSHHSVIMAKIFYDEGYSVIIQGSHFQWEFVKSMPDGYFPGVPSDDAVRLKEVTAKIVDKLQEKYNCNFREKVVIGTSFGALETLFLANEEYKNNTLNISKFISINPPIELIYAMKQVDKNNEDWKRNPDNLKERVALTAAKIVNLLEESEQPDFKLEQLPFSDTEAKLITGFVMHQKLSDLIFALENTSKTQKTDFYKNIYNTSYQDYMDKYILGKNLLLSYDDLNYDTSLYSISDYLKCSDNYKIFHTLDDYLVTPQQLAQLKKYTGNKSIYFSNGSHLGYMYRQEFLDNLKKEISLGKDVVAIKNKN